MGPSNQFVVKHFIWKWLCHIDYWFILAAADMFNVHSTEFRNSLDCCLGAPDAAAVAASSWSLDESKLLTFYSLNLLHIWMVRSSEPVTIVTAAIFDSIISFRFNEP